MSQKNRHQILEVKAETIPLSQKEALENQLRDAGFNPEDFSPFEKALLMQIGIWGTHLVDEIREFGSMVEDYIGEGEEEE